MVAAQEKFRLSPQDYFDWEASQGFRHEYIDGEVFAMTGGSLVHADIALNIATVLRTQIKGHGKVRNSDAKVGVSEDGPFFYPDVSVTCDQRDRTAERYSSFPCVIFEVLSPSTEAYDRGLKFQLYRQLESLQYYVLVGSESRTIEIFHRQSLGHWEFIPCIDGQEITFESLEIAFSYQEIYQDTLLDPT